jgi:benzylsuccinate CoA-transferase BbsE subunit
MSEWISNWKAQDLYQAAQKARVPFAPINTMKDLFENPQLLERGFFAEIDQPGIGKLTLPGMPSRYGVTRWSLRRPAPALGQHSEEVFCTELGVTADRLKTLRAAGVA